MGDVEMKFDSLEAFFFMDGHGAFVWFAYAITLLVLSINLWWPRHVRKQLIKMEKNFRKRVDAGSGER